MAERGITTTPHETESDPTATERLERQILRKVTLRLLPFLCLLYVINILDRSNVAFARLKMLKDLDISEEAYGLGAGLFFIGYFAFEVPSNLILSRIGACRWIARIMISWGVISSCMMFVTGPWSFYLLRLLLGFAEAGFFPGILLYLTYWFPARQRARVVAQFMIASPLAYILGGPLSGALMEYMHQVAGLQGWQWVFLIEGIPGLVLGVIVFFRLPDRPEHARWLTPQERTWLTERIASEEESRERRHKVNLAQALATLRVWHLIALYSTVAASIAAMGSYLPKFIEDRFPDAKEFDIGLLTAVPGIVTIVVMVLVSVHSDRTGERRWHIAGPALFAAAGWGMYAAFEAPLLSLLGLTLAQAGMMSLMGPFWSLPTSFLTGRAAAGGIALINAFGNLGGFFGPNIIAQLKSPNGAFSWGLTVMAILLCTSAALALGVRYEPEQRATE